MCACSQEFCDHCDQFMHLHANVTKITFSGGRAEPGSSPSDHSPCEHSFFVCYSITYSNLSKKYAITYLMSHLRSKMSKI